MRQDIGDANERAAGRFFTAMTAVFAAGLIILFTASLVQSYYLTQAGRPPKALHDAVGRLPMPPGGAKIWVSDQYHPGDPRLLRVVAGGDVMMGSIDVATNPAIVPGVDAASLIGDGLAAIFRRADLAFVNLEGPFYDGDAPTSKVGCTRCYAFRSPRHYADVLASLRISVVSLANNHSGDYGEEGRRSTLDELRKRAIGYAGLDRADARFAQVALRDGRQAAAIAFSPNNGTLDLNDLAEARRAVSALKHRFPVVIVSFHGGGEGWDRVHVPDGHEMFAGEDRGDVKQFAHSMIDAGADLVIGHGPHVPRAVEIYRGRLIAYSLGNFWTYEGVSTEAVCGLGPVLEGWIAPDGRIAGFTLHATRQTGTGVPRLDPSQEASRYVTYLTQSDFPETARLIEKALKTETGS